MELPTVTSETVKEATIYERPKQSKKKMPKMKKTLPRALFTIFENQGFTDFIREKVQDPNLPNRWTKTFKPTLLKTATR